MYRGLESPPQQPQFDISNFEMRFYRDGMSCKDADFPRGVSCAITAPQCRREQRRRPQVDHVRYFADAFHDLISTTRLQGCQPFA